MCARSGLLLFLPHASRLHTGQWYIGHLRHALPVGICPYRNTAAAAREEGHIYPHRVRERRGGRGRENVRAHLCGLVVRHISMGSLI
ncbi:hypothetical protein GGS23DRAFT_572779 [Durotheca rogersii]|uniref:uncharacterized protein n=1 Tax=Durotheca rogersii TaxID=419775 RepID=UPI00221E5394|nr:uncharacterized protein GGS23DRAFT_572779 [Durotheca rogersii]KAI5862117.1 hypothetical protein GGS23DRAFT_572779 [Durotheca rogersii]